MPTGSLSGSFSVRQLYSGAQAWEGPGGGSLRFRPTETLPSLQACVPDHALPWPPPPQPAGPSPRWRSHGRERLLRTTERTCTPQAPLPRGWRGRTPGSESLGEGRKGVMQVVGHRAQHSPYPQRGGAQALASLKPGLNWEGNDKGSSGSTWCSLTHPPSMRIHLGFLELPHSGPGIKDACCEVGAGGGGGRMATLWLHSSVCTWAVSLSTLLFSRSFSHLWIAAPWTPSSHRLPHTTVCVHGVWIYTSYRTSFFIPLILTCLSGLKKTPSVS